MRERVPILVLVIVLAAGAASGKSWKSTIAEARAEAKTRNQLILVEMYADWCGWCKKMAREVFPTETFQQATKNLVLLKVDTEDGQEGTKLAADMEVQALPTMLLLTHDMRLAGAIQGYAPAPQFVAQLDQTVQAWKSFQDRLAQEQMHAADYHWRFSLAKDFMAHKDFSGAEKRLNTLAGDRELPAELWGAVVYHVALAQAGRSDYTASVKTIDMLLKKETQGDLAEQGSVLRAQILYQQRDYEGALAELKRFQKAFPRSALLPSVMRMLPVFERAAAR